MCMWKISINIILTVCFFKHGTSVTIKVIELKCSVCNPNVLVERRVSQNFDFGPSFDFMSVLGSFYINFYIS